MYKNTKLFQLLMILLVVMFSPATVFAQEPAGDEPVAEMKIEESVIWWQPVDTFEQISLSVSGPGEVYFQADFSSNNDPFFSLLDDNGAPHPDGSYTYELVASPVVDPLVRRALDTVTEENRAAVQEQLRASGKLPAPAIQSGYFLVVSGRLILGDHDEGPRARDQQILDDLIVGGSACIGQDCANGESFGFDTIRLKENNLRIKFQDTSNSASFPSNDWQITANDSSNGGANKFSIDDIDGGRTPFTIEASAPSHSLYVDDGGRIGMGTSTPVVELHVVNGDSPTLRLEQDGSSGFTPQTWDVAGNETNFFVRDASNGSTLPFRIQPSAPSNSVFVEGTGSVGIGTASPSGSLHIVDSNDAEPRLLVQDSSGTTAIRTVMELRNKGDVVAEFEDTDGTVWLFQYGAGGQVTKINGTRIFWLRPEGQLEIRKASDLTVNFSLESTGDLTIAGALTENSDVSAKENFIPVDGEDVLAKVAEIPISTWNFKDNGPSIRHLGPMAQDFYAAFGLGKDDKHIATLDTSGVALASIQALLQRVEDQNAHISQLEAQNAELENRLESLESLIESLLVE
ncbi:MAG: tail fiber domain-containing protein [Chloroflexota bacterium]